MVYVYRYKCYIGEFINATDQFLNKDFFFVCHQIQVPAKPNYSLVLYYAADRPINKNSLLAKFVDGSDAFRDSRFKLIPSIVEVCDPQ